MLSYVTLTSSDLFVCGLCFFLFKQKAAYDMRISDWSSDVCSSDLLVGGDKRLASIERRPRQRQRRAIGPADHLDHHVDIVAGRQQHWIVNPFECRHVDPALTRSVARPYRDDPDPPRRPAPHTVGQGQGWYRRVAPGGRPVTKK